jgi:hypothetical protein
MKNFSSYLKEDDNAPDASAPAEPKSVLQNPSYMHNMRSEAISAAQKMMEGQSDATVRAYVLSYKYYHDKQTKPFVVAQNKQLVSQESNWEAKGYTIVAWVSPTDGVVVRTKDGQYVKDTGQ